jgi:hypothetical protein
MNVKKRYFSDIIIKTARDSSDSGDKHTKPNNFAALMRLKNVSTDIIANGDRGDIKTMSLPFSIFVSKHETNKSAENITLQSQVKRISFTMS